MMPCMLFPISSNFLPMANLLFPLLHIGMAQQHFFGGVGGGGGDAYVQHDLLIDNHTTIVTPYKIVFRSALSVDFFFHFSATQ